MIDTFLNIILPDSWVWSKSKEIGLIINGDRGKNYPSRRHYVEKGIPFITAGHLSDGKLSFNEMNYITESKFEALNSGKLLLGDIIYCLRGTLGKCAIYMVDKKAAIASSLAILRLHNFVNRNFVFYYLQSPFGKELVKKYDNGTAQPNLSAESFAKYTIPIPPLPEQHRIVAKIEELFTSLDKGIESLTTAQQQLKVYRQAVFKRAFEGKLTNKHVAEGKLPEGWKWVKLSEVCDKIQDGSHFSPQVQYDEPSENRFPYITAKNIRNDYMDLSKLTYVDREYHESIYGRCNPEYGDVLLTKDGVNTGEVTLNSIKNPFSLLSSVCIFKTKKKDLKSEFLKYFIQSPFGLKAITNSMTGTAIKRIILRKLKEASIILPTLPEQERIVSEIESRLSVCDKIEESIEQSLKQSEALRQSILKKAFEGKLVPQNPSDEPANVLLQRIKSEREKNKPENLPGRQARKAKTKKAKS